MVMNPGITTVEIYQDREILAFPGHGGPIVSVLLALGQGDLLAGTILGKSAATAKYEKYVPAVPATLITGDVADNNAILFTSKKSGTVGNAIKLQIKDPGAASKVLGVSMVIDTIVISLATNTESAITTTAAEVIAAVNSALGVKDILSAANAGASTGAGVAAAVAVSPLADGADANVVPKVVLAENVPDQAGDVTVTAYLGGAFYTSMLVGLDAEAMEILNARQVDDVIVVPV